MEKTWKSEQLVANLGTNAFCHRDYKEMPHLDFYSSSQLDDADYEPLPLDTRLQVDAELNRRDQEILRRQGRIPDIFLPDLSSKMINRLYVILF